MRASGYYPYLEFWVLGFRGFNLQVVVEPSIRA